VAKCPPDLVAFAHGLGDLAADLLRHYLIVRAEARTIIRHQRDDGGAILTRIIRDGSLTLDPPGLELSDVFG
jgi:hypothetical protein